MLFALFILASGALMLFVFWQSLKDGYVPGDWWPRHYRADNPIAYWLSQILLLLAGLLLVGAGLSGIIIR